MQWEATWGPQLAALESPADELFFGGAAGGGKTDLLLGAAHTQHHRSIIFRREYAQMEAIEERATELFSPDPAARFNGTKHRWRWSDGGRVVEFGSAEGNADVNKYQGRAHDLKGFDELPHFTRYQYEFLIAWNRTTRPGQRCRVIAAGNPPTDAEGDWVIDYWGPWLDKRHPNPAKPGELRWYAKVDGKDVERPNGESFLLGNELIEPKSRTFIPARVEDNPFLMAEGYKRTLQNLPEPLRSKMLFGDFGISQLDDAWQVIPTAWIDAAMARWTDKPKDQRGRLDALGVDVARGGGDKTVYTPRYGGWFDKQIVQPGKSTPDGQSVIRDVIGVIGAELKGARVQLDVIGIGSSPTDIGKMFDLNVIPLNSSQGSSRTDKTGKLRFVNKRAEWAWALREALHPDSGEDLAICPDRELAADLGSFRWSLKSRGIQIESKDDIKERIHRSPDKGESLIYAHAQPEDEFIVVVPIVDQVPRNLPGQYSAPIYSFPGE